MRLQLVLQLLFWSPAIITNFINKKIRILFFLLLCGCESSSLWHVSHQKGSEKKFDSARLSYPVRDRVNEVAVEMVYSKKSLRTYLEIHSQTIPPYQGNPQHALVKVKTPEHTCQGIAHRHQGGQRVTLPTDLQEVLVEALMKNSPVTIELMGYSTTLQPDNFALFYQELQKSPLKIPFKISFKL